jgi:cytidine deaminase
MNKEHLDLVKPYLTKCYSPYSKFNVACMLVCNDPDKSHEMDSDACLTMHYGVNVENCSYSLTTCAEKNCITSAITDGVNLKNALYMIVITDTADTITPCGACRQILSEFFSDTFTIYTCGNNNIVSEYTVGELLPAGFRKK